jgi:hypothetical protein
LILPVRNTRFSVEEGRIITEAHKDIRNKWVDVAKLLPGRTGQSAWLTQPCLSRLVDSTRRG